MEFHFKKGQIGPLVRVNPAAPGAGSILSLDEWEQWAPYAVATFSMINPATGRYIVANRPADVRTVALDPGASPCLDGSDGPWLVYQLSSLETQRVGRFIGEFRLDFVGVGPDGPQDSLVYPANGELLEIFITDSITSTSLPQIHEPIVDNPDPEPPVDPGTDTIDDYTYAEIRQLADSGTLSPGVWYRMTDYRTKHFFRGLSTSVVQGPIEPLLVWAVTRFKIDERVVSTVNPQDIISYDLFDDTVTCDDAFGLVCTNSGSTSRTGRIVYREDRKNNLSAYFDWRGWQPAMPTGSAGTTFGTDCRNIRIAADAGNIQIGDNSHDITIAENCRFINLGENSSNVRIGRNVYELELIEYDSTFVANRGLLIDDYKLGGELRATIPIGNGDLAFTLGEIPENAVLTDLAIQASDVGAYLGNFRMGVVGVASDNIMPQIPASEFEDALITATLAVSPVPAGGMVQISLVGGNVGSQLTDDSLVQVALRFGVR